MHPIFDFKHIPNSAKFWQIKLWRMDHFRVLARKMLANLTLVSLVNLEFSWVKYW